MGEFHPVFIIAISLFYKVVDARNVILWMLMLKQITGSFAGIIVTCAYDCSLNLHSCPPNLDISQLNSFQYCIVELGISIK